MTRRRNSNFIFVVLALIVACGGSEGERVDADFGNSDSTSLSVVTLAPHLAEMMYDIGAEDMLVGVSAFTDYPDAALHKPVIGDAFMVDQEQIAVLQPGLILAWESGTPRHLAEELVERGYRVELIRTRGLRDVADALIEVGRLTGHERQAEDVAARFLEQLDTLAADYRNADPIRVFYQVDKRPIYTINGDHFVSQLIEICGGVNIFADIGDLAPLVGVEAVIERNPEVMLASEDARPDAFSEWLRWPMIAANRYQNRFYMPAGEIGRASTRLAQAGRTLCNTLDRGRGNRKSRGNAS